MTLLCALREAVEAQKRLRDLYALAADGEKEKEALAFLVALSVEKQRGLILLWDKIAQTQGDRGLIHAVTESALLAPSPAPKGPAVALVPEMKKRLEFYQKALQEEKKTLSVFVTAGEEKSLMAGLAETASIHIQIIERIIEHLTLCGRLPDPANAG